MISASDAVVREVDPAVAAKGGHAGWPVASITPLQFEKIEHPLRRRTDWMLHPEEGAEDEEGRLRAELATAEGTIRLHTQQLASQLAEARNAGKMEAKREFDAELLRLQEKERAEVLKCCKTFTEARTQYFGSVEAEVVRLALGIAARVLHREAKLDPLLLSAVVRMALEKVEDDSQAVLHVPVKDAEAWRTMLAAEHQTAVRVVGEDRMNPAECMIETTVGRVELGVNAQLDEIEKGFFDLLQQRPV